MKKKWWIMGMLVVMLGSFGFLSLTGCASHAGTGALAGSGLGALTGQIIGKDTTSTLIGAGIGAGTGYVIGRQSDKKRAAEQKVKATYAPLGGTRWQVVSIKPSNKVPKFTSKVVEFRNNGHVVSTTIYPDKSRDVSTENYRVMGSTLIVNRKGYIINYKFSINGNTMVARADKVVVNLRRLK